MEIEAPPRAQYIRTIIAELERIHSHLLWLGVAAHEVGFNTLFMWTWRDREAVQDTLEEMTGNRVNYGINTIGGVRRDLTPAQVKDALARVPVLEDRLAKYMKMLNSEETVLIRFRGIGKLSKAEALKLGTVGPTARASGVEYDIRRDQPYIAYNEIPWKVATSTSGDVYGRTIVRITEMQESLGIVRHCLEALPEGAIRVDSPKTAPETEVLSRYEAPRGELVHFIRTNNTDKVERVDIRTPTLANWTSVAVSLVGQNLADIPVIVAAIDPCLSCTSRITVVNEKGKTIRKLSFEQLRKHADEFYRERGRT